MRAVAAFAAAVVLIASSAFAQPPSYGPEVTPEIIVSRKPAALLWVQGPAQWTPAGAPGVERLSNSNALVLRYENRNYLSYADYWASASQLFGTWRKADTVPAPVRQARDIAVGQGLGTVANPSAYIRDALDTDAFVEVFTRNEPTELILIEGEPKAVRFGEASLAYVSNTQSDVFISGARSWYVLIGGRWFSGLSEKGPWMSMKAEDLPGAFSQIPPDSPKAAVLASVPRR